MITEKLVKLWRNTIFYALRQSKRSIKKQLEKICVLIAVRRFCDNLKIIVGSANTKQKGWVSTNYPQLDLCDKVTFSTLFESNSVSNFLAEHVWEHLSLEDGDKACSNCFSFLKKGGVLRIAVPDGFHVDADYIAQVKPGGYGAGADDHKVLYNYKILSALLESAGYAIRLLEWFDEQARFHYENWDPEDGFIERSTRFDQRNQVNPTTYTSLIIDGIKP